MASVFLCPQNYLPVKRYPISTGVLGRHRPSLIRGKYKIRAVDFLGDFGARDATAPELESNFGEKVVGNFGTDHKILVPSASALSLAHMPIQPIPPAQSPMTRRDATALLRKIVGWKLVEVDGGLRLDCLWKVKSFAAGMELLQRIGAVAEAAKHHPDLHLQGGHCNTVSAQIWTHSI
ncbi:hypothetical protein KI387_001322, partial [Taxus chinensis]